MRATTVIPCRSGSEGVKNKNLRKVGGVSLLERTIQHAKDAELVDTIVVSTSCPDIEAEAKRCGATVIHRASYLSKPDVMVWEAVRTVAEHYKACHAMPDLFLELHVTYPFRPASLIDRVISELDLGNEYCSVMCASEIYDRIWRKDGYTYRRAVPDIEIKRRQEQEPLFIDHYGLVNCYSPRVALQGNPYNFPVEFYTIEKDLYAFDIDTEEHMQIAERIMT